MQGGIIMNSAVELRGIEKSFLGIAALRSVDFSVLPGEVHALVGENGAGKSTLMGVLSGKLAPDRGGDRDRRNRHPLRGPA